VAKLDPDLRKICGVFHTELRKTQGKSGQIAHFCISKIPIQYRGYESTSRYRGTNFGGSLRAETFILRTDRIGFGFADSRLSPGGGNASAASSAFISTGEALAITAGDALGHWEPGNPAGAPHPYVIGNGGPPHVTRSTTHV
jgi:hypothetical protein